LEGQQPDKTASADLDKELGCPRGKRRVTNRTDLAGQKGWKVSREKGKKKPRLRGSEAVRVDPKKETFG